MSEKGNAFLLKARQQFRDRRIVETLRSIEVPEFGRIFYWPVRSRDEMVATERFIRFGERTKADLTEFHLAQVLHRSRDEFGNRMFADADETALADVDPGLLERISLQMGLGNEPTVEDAEKN